MGLFSFLHGRTGKLFIHRLYGWGAALVILGALFKLMHWEGAGLMLTIGMTTECIIFFFSAFEPMAKEYDWSLVYPEFSDEDITQTKGNKKPAQQTAYNAPSGSGWNINIPAETQEKIGSGVEKLAASLDQMANLSGIVDASNNLTGNMSRASQSMATIADSANVLTDNYQKTAQSVSLFNEQSKSGLEQIRLGYDNYRGQLDNLGNTLSAVNSSFELYLTETKKVQSDYSQLHNEMGVLISNVQTSANQTQAFGNQMEGLNNSIAQLNSIYGSMLTAVNSVINK